MASSGRKTGIAGVTAFYVFTCLCFLGTYTSSRWCEAAEAGAWRGTGWRLRVAAGALAAMAAVAHTAAMTTERSVQRREGGWVGEYST